MTEGNIGIDISKSHLDELAHYGDDGDFGGFSGVTERGVFRLEIRIERIRPVSARFQVFSACQFQGMSSSMRLIL